MARLVEYILYPQNCTVELRSASQLAKNYVNQRTRPQIIFYDFLSILMNFSNCTTYERDEGLPPISMTTTAAATDLSAMKHG